MPTSAQRERHEPLVRRHIRDAAAGLAAADADADATGSARDACLDLKVALFTASVAGPQAEIGLLLDCLAQVLGSPKASNEEV